MWARNHFQTITGKKKGLRHSPIPQALLARGGAPLPIRDGLLLCVRAQMGDLPRVMVADLDWRFLGAFLRWVRGNWGASPSRTRNHFQIHPPRLCGVQIANKIIMTKSEKAEEQAPTLIATAAQGAENKIKLSLAIGDGTGSTILKLSTKSDAAGKNLTILRGFLGTTSFFVIRVGSLWCFCLV